MSLTSEKFTPYDVMYVNHAAKSLLNAIPLADYDLDCGLCSNIVKKLREQNISEEMLSEETVHDIIAMCFESWFYWGGNYLYPVGGKEEYESNRKWFGESLQKRLSLLRHIIKMTEE